MRPLICGTPAERKTRATPRLHSPRADSLMGGSMASSLRQRIARLEAHHRLIVSWDAYAACFLFLAWTRFFSISPRDVARIATLQHASRMVIFVGVLLA